MGFDAAIAYGLLSRRRMGWFGTIALASAAVAISLGVAGWIAGSDLFALASAVPLGNTNRISSFEDRFFPASMHVSPADGAALHPLHRSALAVVETKVRAAQALPRG